MINNKKKFHLLCYKRQFFKRLEIVPGVLFMHIGLFRIINLFLPLTNVLAC